MKCKFNISFLVILATMTSAILSCSLNQRESIETVKQEFYLIDPQILLVAIEKEELIFTSQLSIRPESIPSTQQELINWSSIDYIRIVEAVFLQVWGDTRDGWALNTMVFGLSCNATSYGMQYGNYQFFKNDSNSGEEVRWVRTIDIDPRNKFIYVWERKYSPKLVNWSVVDLERNILADDILKIAEVNGGLEARSGVDNKCSITLLLNPDRARYKGWYIRYTNNIDQKDIVYLNVNPITGEITK